MSYTFKQNLVSSSKYSIKCPKTRTPKFVVIHNTYNDASAKNEVSYHNSNNNQVSFHIAVDDVEAIQCVDFGRNTWSCGDGANGKGNLYGISLEICYSKSGGSKYTQAEENAVYVAARLLHQYGLGIDKLKQHADFASKNCPHRIRDEKRWDGFVGRVQWVLDEIKKGNIDKALSSGTTSAKQTTTSQPTTSNPTTTATSSSYKVGDKIKVKTTATHYATGQSMASFVKGSTYEVTKVDGNKLLLSSISSWVWDYDVEKVGATTTTNSTATEYKVKIVNCTVLNVRKGAGTNYAVATTVKAGEVYTIVGETSGWLKLKSGAGYISKSYTQKI